MKRAVRLGLVAVFIVAVLSMAALAAPVVDSKIKDDNSVKLVVKKNFPVGMDYVFVCKPKGFKPVFFSYWFGDGEKLINIKNGNVFHTYLNPGNYTAKCSATNGKVTESDTLKIQVGDDIPVV